MNISTSRSFSNHYINIEAAVANLRRQGCLQSRIDDEVLRPAFDVGPPPNVRGYRVIQDNLGRYLYTHKLHVVA